MPTTTEAFAVPPDGPRPGSGPARTASARPRVLAVFCTFTTVGIGLGSWITRTPDLRDTLDASTSAMGFILFGMALGSMAGVLTAEPLVRRVGTRSVVALALGLLVAGLAGFALAGAVGSAPVAFLGLTCFGAGMGSIDIAINLEGVDVERILGRSILPALHGSASLGIAAGAALGILATAQEVSIPAHLTTIAALTVAPALLVPTLLAPGFGVTPRTPRRLRSATGSSSRVWRERRMPLIGLVVLGMALAEGAGNDWLPLLMVDGHDYAEQHSSLVFAVFAGCMGLGRVAGSPLVDRLGRSRAVRGSGLLCMVGIGLVILAEDPIVAGIAVAIWGLGASLGFPLAVSAANDGEGDRQAHVAAIAKVGYLAFLVGPPVLGLLGEEYGLRNAMLPVVVVVVLSVLAAGATRDSTERVSATEAGLGPSDPDPDRTARSGGSCGSGGSGRSEEDSEPAHDGDQTRRTR